MSRSTTASIHFDAPLSALEGVTMMRLPLAASGRLPSRGQVAVDGTLNGVAFQTVLEPDGSAGHWLRIPPALQRAAHVAVGDKATVAFTVAAAWPEPAVPSDLAAALAAAPSVIREVWSEITPMARWEWVRWVNATRNPDTRQRRVEVSISKMEAGKRRPCCFNLSACTDPDLSRSGKLMELPEARP